MFTQWHQIEDFIKDNGAEKWSVTRQDPSRRSGDDKGTFTDKILDSSLWKERTLDQKLDLTKRMLEAYGDRCYIQLYGSEGSNRAVAMMEICLSGASQQAQTAVGFVPQPMAGGVDEAALTDRIRKEIKIEYEQREYDRERKEFEKERKEFEAAKNSTLGAIVGYLAPYLPVLNSALQHKQVAGLDTTGDIEAARIHATEPEVEPEAEPEAESEFTDEEADKLLVLMKRFKKVETDYLPLLEAVVKMAESGDTNYTLAKGFLMK